MTTLLTGGSSSGRGALDDDVDLVRDRALVTRAQSGDRSAFDDLYLRYYRRLYRFCLRRLHDSHEAEDVAQEAFARAWRALPTFGGDRRFYPWLSVIASHLCTDVLRRRNRSTPVAEFHQGNVASTEDGGEDVVIAAVDSDLVARAFTRLSDRHQRILSLREGSGWSYQRIADHEGVGITAVETLLWRARQALKREFASLAGADGRMGAWLGGLLSVASLRRLLSVPRRGLRKVAATGARGAVVTAGSAVAAGAVIVGATLSGPAGPVPSPSRADVQQAGAGATVPAASGGAVSGIGDTATGGSSSGTAGGGAAGSLPVPGGGLPGASQLGSSVGSTLTTTVNGLTNTVNGVIGTTGGVVNGVVNGVATSTGSLLPSPLTNLLDTGGSTLSGTTSGTTTSGTGTTTPLGTTTDTVTGAVCTTTGLLGSC